MNQKNAIVENVKEKENVSSEKNQNEKKCNYVLSSEDRFTHVERKPHHFISAMWFLYRKE